MMGLGKETFGIHLEEFISIGIAKLNTILTQSKG